MTSPVGALSLLLLLSGLPASADFSYTMTRRTSAGASVAGSRGRGGAAQVFRYYFKNGLVKVETADTATILDLPTRQRSVAAPKVDVKETGGVRLIRAWSAKETILTIPLDSPELQLTGTKMEMEMDAWLTVDVVGASPGWYVPVPSSGGDPAIESGIEVLLSKVAALNAVPLEAAVRVKRAKAALPLRELTHAQRTQMREAMAQLAVIRLSGGPQAAIAARALAEMSAMTDPIELAEADPTLFEITIENSDFSTAPIPDSVFARQAH